MPEKQILSRHAFALAFREGGTGDDIGEDARMRARIGSRDDRLARALHAAREVMSCYGRLEAELRIVQVWFNGRIF